MTSQRVVLPSQLLSAVLAWVCSVLLSVELDSPRPPKRVRVTRVLKHQERQLKGILCSVAQDSDPMAQVADPIPASQASNSALKMLCRGIVTGGPPEGHWLTVIHNGTD